ncbi:MAG: carbohydrate ABC transporter permease [Chloroflexota bacterium]|jgi:multiple sugar transport system permease protein|nr:carbohydrate ABC transporter permease [Chloroflexota bacterium]
MSKSSKFLRSFIRVYLPVIFICVITLFPFYWMVLTAFKENRELNDTVMNPFIFNMPPTWEHFEFLFVKTKYATWIVNTLLVSIISTTVSVLVSIMAGYSLGRLRFRGANWLGWAIFVTYLVPPTLLFIPLTEVVSKIDLPLNIWKGDLTPQPILNSIWSLILVYPTFLVPFGTWLLIGYFKGIPRELEESALVDGATRIQAMTKIIVPLALPGLLSVAIFAFTLSWNEFIYALVFISDVETKTVPVGVISELIRGDVFFWGELMAGALLGSVPVAIIYSFFVDYFVSGLTAGAVKG